MERARVSRGFGLGTAGVLVVAAALLGWAGRAGAQSACGAFVDPDDCADDFTCYVAWTTKGTPAAVPATVTLADQFEVATATVRKQVQLCAPSNKNAEGVHDPATHLTAYVIKGQTPKHIRRGAIRVTNQLETVRVDTVKADLLLVPTAKTLTQPGPPPPNPGLHAVDHFKCYKVRVTPGTPLPALNRKVTVSDQFTSPARILTLRKPRHLCVPVDKNGEGIKNPTAHLLCYAAKPARGEPKHIRREGLFINNQLGPLRVNTIKEREFCIPSLKSLSPSGAFLDPVF